MGDKTFEREREELLDKLGFTQHAIDAIKDSVFLCGSCEAWTVRWLVGLPNLEICRDCVCEAVTWASMQAQRDRTVFAAIESRIGGEVEAASGSS